MKKCGGRRPGAGRRASTQPLKARCIKLSDDHCRLLRIWGRGDMTAGLRWLIDAAAPFIRRADDD